VTRRECTCVRRIAARLAATLLLAIAGCGSDGSPRAASVPTEKQRAESVVRQMSDYGRIRAVTCARHPGTRRRWDCNIGLARGGHVSCGIKLVDGPQQYMVCATSRAGRA
jgi:hypothetical protein